MTETTFSVLVTEEELVELEKFDDARCDADQEFDELPELALQRLDLEPQEDAQTARRVLRWALEEVQRVGVVELSVAGQGVLEQGLGWSLRRELAQPPIVIRQRGWRDGHASAVTVLEEVVAQLEEAHTGAS